MATLAATSELLLLLADPTRVRLLRLLAEQELSVAELTAATGLPQPRVSTHLARLRKAGLVRVRPEGASTFYGQREGALGENGAGRLWALLQENVEDAVFVEDARRLRAALRARSLRRGPGADAGGWADSVAGRMERHYSPGRTWEAAARALIGLAELGDVLDIASGDGALAELLAPRARSVTCLDLSLRVTEAGARRVAAGASEAAGPLPVRFIVGDMHALPLPTASFDQLLLVNTLSYAVDPARVLGEAARVCRPGGAVVGVALKAHKHSEVAAAFDHRQAGFQPARLRSLFSEAGFQVSFCAVTARERRPPHFEIITLYARRSA
ncbi:MAG: ArsR/SmtB family transcription factor [Planctomycetota bacterium]